MKLIDEWWHSWRLWSVRAAALGAAIMAYLATDPMALLTLLNSMPGPLRTLLPEQVMAGFSAIIFGATIYFRVLRQPIRKAKSDED